MANLIIPKMVIQPKIGHIFEIPLFRYLLAPIVQIHKDSMIFTQLLASLNDLESEPLSCFSFLESIHLPNL